MAEQPMKALTCPSCKGAAMLLPLMSADSTGENGGADFVSWWKVRCGDCGWESMGGRSKADAERDLFMAFLEHEGLTEEEFAESCAQHAETLREARNQ